MAGLRGVGVRSRRARIALRVLPVLGAWYALTSIGFRDGIRAAVLAQEIPDANALPFLAVVETSGYQAGLAGHGDQHIVVGVGPVWRAVSTKAVWVS